VYTPEAFGLRLVGRVAADTPRGNIWDTSESCGWYTDPDEMSARDGTGLCWGVVYQLPGRHGRARFVAGYQFGGTDGGPLVDFGKIFESASDWNAARAASYAADSMARTAAEKEKDYQTAWLCGQAYADAGEEIERLRTEIKEAIRQWRDAKAALPNAETRFGRLCALIRDDVADALADIRAARETRRKAIEGEAYGHSVYMGEIEQGAFCEATGLETMPA
jgi:hypothetical protein